VEQPAEPEPFCNRIKIRSYPVEEYLGLIFVYQGEGEPPPLQRYPDLEREGALRILTYVRICNFFNNVENGLDPAHVPFTHGGGRDFGPREASAMRIAESEFGVNTWRDRTRGPIQVNQFGMPNILLRKNSRPGEDALAWRVPVDDETHVSFAVDRLHRPGDMTECQVLVDTEPSGKDTVNEISLRIMAGELHPDDLKGDRNLFNIQDTVTQAGQGAIADRSAEHLGRSDQAIVKIRELWTRELRALAEGRPLKPWQRTHAPTIE
jgi:5,5'-dehydrodivanillate O-demethylase